MILISKYPVNQSLHRLTMKLFASMGVDSLTNGLDEQENRSPFATTGIEKAIWLILSGLTRIDEQK
jgi:hypothetical protein